VQLILPVVVEVELLARLLAAAVVVVQEVQGALEAAEVELLQDCLKRSVNIQIKRSSIKT
jgi:hypothetical protein